MLNPCVKHASVLYKILHKIEEQSNIMLLNFIFFCVMKISSILMLFRRYLLQKWHKLRRNKLIIPKVWLSHQQVQFPCQCHPLLTNQRLLRERLLQNHTITNQQLSGKIRKSQLTPFSYKASTDCTPCADQPV